MIPRIKPWLLIALCVAAGAVSTPAVGFLVDDEQQRRDYLAAQEALRAGNHARFRALADRLSGYVLYGYLEYEILKDWLATAPTPVVRKFLEENSQAPVSDVLRKKWLRLLAARGDWETFIREYKDIENDHDLQCQRLSYLLRASEQQAALMDEIEQLWLTGRRLPAVCEPVFAAWKAAGHMTSEKVWKRIGLAMENRSLSLAGELAKYLEPQERVWVGRWQAMHRQPAPELENIRYPVETPVARMIVKHGIVRLAFRDPEEAMRQWERIKDKYQFFGEDENYVLRNIGILAAQYQLPQALKWLAAVSADPSDEALHLWRVRAAIRAGEWETAKRFIAGLSEEQQQHSQWRYWQARILQQTGDRWGAEKMFAKLARERGYYGFLAADRIAADYSMQHAAIEAGPEEISVMLARPGIQMAQELYLMGLVTDARRQWHWTTRHMNNRELQVAAVLALQWGWHDRAIFTVSRSDHQDDLELRFPVLYRDAVESNAAAHGVDAGWVYGVMRQESAFVADARSPAGALGLMQLMPATGILAGRKLKLNIRSRQALLDVENNLRLGVSYLKEVLDRNRGHQVLATAAYNAGPNRISTWIPQAEPLAADVWVENIPYNETRDYVKNVMAYTAVYDYRLGQRPTRLKDRMPPITPAGSSK